MISNSNIKFLDPSFSPYVDPETLFDKNLLLPGSDKPAQGMLTEIPNGMLGISERTVLYLLARDYCKGQGIIIDAGCFCGTSTILFAEGLLANTALSSEQRKIHSFDLFAVNAPYIISCLNDYYGVKIQEGSFLPLFKQFTNRFKHCIQVYAGDLMTQQWPDDPNEKIEILFIDVAKDTRLLERCLRLFMPNVIYGHTLMVHQDYYWLQQGYIPLAMEYLSEYFTPWVSRIDSTAIFRCERPIPEEKLARIGNFDFSEQEIKQFSERLLEKLSPQDGKFVKLSIAVFNAYNQRNAGDPQTVNNLKKVVERLIADYPLTSDMHWQWMIQNANNEWGFGLNI